MGKTPSRRTVIMGAAASAVVLTPFSVTARTPIVHNVSIKSFAFDPAHIRVHIGDTIRWTNHDLAPHTATANAFGWDTQKIVQGNGAEILVTTGMEPSYFCVFHPHMKGTIEIL